MSELTVPISAITRVCDCNQHTLYPVFIPDDEKGSGNFGFLDEGCQPWDHDGTFNFALMRHNHPEETNPVFTIP